MAAMIAHMVGAAAYGTSKAAVALLTKAAAIDYVEHNIRVNSVHPGSMATPFAIPYLEDPETRPAVLGRTPMARPADPAEVATTVAFLASDEASYMTGSELVVDGGWLAS
jgi:NAD(P)-dependent dehydrogenase (short-subunit alcohol dehydrogenase family)